MCCRPWPQTTVHLSNRPGPAPQQTGAPCWHGMLLYCRHRRLKTIPCRIASSRPIPPIHLSPSHPPAGLPGPAAPRCQRSPPAAPRPPQCPARLARGDRWDQAIRAQHITPTDAALHCRASGASAASAAPTARPSQLPHSLAAPGRQRSVPPWSSRWLTGAQTRPPRAAPGQTPALSAPGLAALPQTPVPPPPPAGAAGWCECEWLA